MLFLGVGIGLFMLFIFWASGSVISDIFRLNITNTFVNIGIGFFSYFAFVSLLIFPLQLISIVPYILSWYIFCAFTIIYIVITFAFTKFWFRFYKFSLNLLTFAFIFIIIFVMNYLFNNKLDKNSSSSFLNSISILYWIKDIQFSLFGDNLSGKLVYKNLQSWYTFQLSWLAIFDLSNEFMNDRLNLLKSFYEPLNIIIETGLCASVILAVHSKLIQNRRVYLKNISLLFITLLMIGFKVLLWNLNIDFWSDEIYFAYLVIFILILFSDFLTSSWKSKNQPIVMGILISSYIAFSWTASYQMLFLIYAMLFISQIYLKDRFIKVFYKFSFAFMIDFILYNLIQKLYLLCFISFVFVIFFSFILFFMNKNYNFVVNFENSLNTKSKFTITIISIIFIIASVFINLASYKSFIITTGFSDLVFYGFFSIFWLGDKYYIARILSYAILGLAFFWILYRYTLKLSKWQIPIDFIAIIYITFLNPFSTVTLSKFLFTNLNLAAWVLMLSFIFVILSELINIIDRLFIKDSESTKSKSSIVYKNIYYIYI